MTEAPPRPRRTLRGFVWRERSRGQRWAIATVALFTLYLLLGFLLVPIIVRHQLIEAVHDATGRELRIERVEFNPLRLALTLSGVDLKEESGESFAGWEQFHANFEASSLFRRAFTFAAIELRKPHVQLRRLDANTFNFTSLLEAAAGAPPAADATTAQDGGALPAIEVQRLRIDTGELVYRDDTHPQAPVLHYLPIDFSVENFSTRARTDGGARAELAITGADGASLRWQGDLTLPVLGSSGRVELAGLDLAALSRFADEQLPFHLARGRVAASARYRLATEPDPSTAAPTLRLEEGTIAAADLAVASKADPATTPIEIAAIQVDGIGVDSAATEVSIQSVGISGGRMAGSLDANGQLDLLQWFAAPTAAAKPTVPLAPAPAPTPAPADSAPVDHAAPAPAAGSGETGAADTPAAPAATAPGTAPGAVIPAPPVGADAPAPPWRVVLADARVDDARVELTDRGPATPVTITVAPLQIRIGDFHSDHSRPVQLEITAGINTSGQVRVSGPIGLEPVQATLKIDAANLPLTGFQPYVSQAINIQLHGGAASAQGTLNYSADSTDGEPAGGVHFRGDLQVDDLKTTDNRFHREFLSWRRLAVKNLDFAQAANRVQIDRVEFDRLYGRFAIRADGTTNVEKLLVPSAEPQTQTAPLAIAIDTVAIRDSAAYFADLSMNPDFRTGIFNLKGGISGIDSTSGKAVNVDLRGQVDRYAPVTIKGTVDPFKASPALDMKLAFQNLDMTTLTPYSGVYAGHRIKQGQLSVDLDYQLNNDHIVGKNRIVMDQMELGERVESPKAIDLPLRLALALLKDSRGVIDLGLEVQGNVNEPSFSVGGLIFTALKNLVVKVVSAPFNLIAGLVGGDADKLDAIDFAPGSATVGEDQRPKLDQLAKALGERPQLQLGITGNALPEQDTAALAERRLERRLAALVTGGSDDGDDQATNWPGLASALGDRAWRKKYYRLYEDTTGESAGTRRKIIAKAMTTGDEEPSAAAIDSALHDHIKQELVARETVPPRELSRLAQERALAVKAYFADRGGIAPERVFLVSDGAAAPALTAKLSLSAR